MAGCRGSYLLLLAVSLNLVLRTEGADFLRPDDGDRPFDFVLGWSTGHVGTTTLSRAASYDSPSGVAFTFEDLPPPFGKVSGGPIRKMPRNYIPDRDEELRFVNERYLPHLLAVRGNATTLVDLGHHNLYFADALLSVLHQYRDRYRVLFVRVRRERYSSPSKPPCYQFSSHHHTLDTNPP